MPQQRPGDGPEDEQLHSALCRDSENMSKISSFDLRQCVSNDYSSAARSSHQVDVDEAHNRLPTTEPSKEKLTEPFFGAYTKWKTVWRLQTIILGLYIVCKSNPMASFVIVLMLTSQAMTCALTHCLFFKYLDGRILALSGPVVAKTTMIPQGYATTISLLLITAFKAALIGSIGLCYTQSLWGTLRKRALKIGLIEDLFQVTTNALHLTSSGLYLETPILAIIALFCWIMPIATVYPPGALTVELHVLPVNTTFNVSVFNANDPIYDEGLSSIYCEWGNMSGPLYGLAQFAEQKPNASNLDGCFVDWIPLNSGLKDAQYVVSSSLVSGAIATLSQPGGLNSSYQVEFWGTVLDCETKNRTVENHFYWHPEKEVSKEWKIADFVSCKLIIDTQSLDSSGVTTISHRAVVNDREQSRYYPCFEETESPALQPEPGPTDTGSLEKYFLMTAEETVCHPKLARYIVTVSSGESGQHVSLSLGEHEHIPAYTSDFKSFDGSFEQWVQFSDELYIYNTFAMALNTSNFYEYGVTFNYTNGANRTAYTSSNGTVVETCTLDKISGEFGLASKDFSDLWGSSVFTRRASSTNLGWSCPRFDMDMAKELLINTTISALALNNHFHTVNGTEMQTFNVYRFKNKLAFFLPYGLSLAIAVPIIALGLISFYAQNHGVSAITGGFLQLLMTTTGRTDLEDMVIKESGTLGGYENVSDELKAVEVRFGELIEVRAGDLVSDVEEAQNLPGGREDGASFVSGADSLEKNEHPMGRVGFGLAHEVRPLRRRNVE